MPYESFGDGVDGVNKYIPLDEVAGKYYKEVIMAKKDGEGDDDKEMF